MKLSACIICKNEEEMIAQMLESIKWVDEIVILDTGSKDNTVEIAKKYTDKVFIDTSFYDEEKKLFNFWEARNKCKEYASGDFILSIDCDETMECWWIGNIKYAIEHTEDIDAILINLENKDAWKTSAFRVFKKELDWVWAIHEIVHPKNPAKLNVTINFWISPAHEKDPHLDLRILQSEYEKNPDDPRTCYYLAREFLNYKQYEEASGLIAKYIGISKSIDEQTDAYYILALCFLMLWKREEAWVAASQAIIRNPNFKAAIELLADIQPCQEWKDRWTLFAESADNTGLIITHDFKQECLRYQS